jgi:phage/plasmid-like protein (TIGR03299 family)
MAVKAEPVKLATRKPWEGLGVELPKGTSIEQALKLAGLNWSVAKVPTFAAVPDDWGGWDGGTIRDINPNGKHTTLLDNKANFALVRTSDNRVMSNVGSGYKPIQNRDAFQIFHDFVKAGQMEMDTAGSLKDGLILWGLASIKSGFKLCDGDEVHGYLMLSQSHMYGQSMSVAFTAVREAGWTTYRKSITDKRADRFTMSHAKTFDETQLREIREVLRTAHTFLDEYREKATLMAGTQFSAKDGIEFLVRSLQPTEAKMIERGIADVPESISGALNSDLLSPTTKDILVSVHRQPGANLKSGGNSVWNWYNAINFACDHELGRTVDTRMESAWFGQRGRTKEKALKLAVQMAKQIRLKKKAA